MARVFNRLFNIRSTEWPRVSLLFLISGLSNAGGTWGATIVYAAFLKQVGLGALPWVLVSSSALSILTIAIYTAFADRIADDRLLIALYALGVASMALGLVLLWLDLPLIAYPVLYLLFLTWLAARNPHFVTYINSFYDIQSAKRILPVVLAGARGGAIIAGLTLPLLLSWFEPPIIIVIWLVLYLLIMGLVWAMPHLLQEGRTPGERPGHTAPVAAAGLQERRPSYIDNMREGLDYTIESTYLRWMALGTLLLMILLALIEYRSVDLLLAAYGSQERLANFLAVLVAVGNTVVLPLLLFVVGRLIARLGLGNVSLIFPAGNLMVCGALTLAPGVVSATAAHFDRTAFRISFQRPSEGLLYNAVPLRVKGRARAFVSGLIVPAGQLMGGLLLLLPLVSQAGWFVPALIGLLAMTYLVSALVIRRQYGQALIAMLEQEDYSFLLSQVASDLTVADPATLRQLRKKLRESTSHELTVFMTQLISRIGGHQVVPIVGPVIGATQDGRTRAAMIDVLVAADLRGDKVRWLYSDFLSDRHGRVRQSAIAGLEQLAGPTDNYFLSRMQEMIQDPDTDVGVRVLLALARSGVFYQFTPAVHALEQLLQDPARRVDGIRVLGQIGDERAVRHLMEYLTDPTDKVRLEAAVAVEALSQNTLPVHINAKMDCLLQDPIERVRQAALIVLGRVGSGHPETYRASVEALRDPSPQVRATAVEALVLAGKSIIPILRPQLDSREPQLRKMATVVLSRVDPGEFGDLVVDSSITGNLVTIYRHHGLVEALAPCSRYPSITVLQSALREQNQQLVDEIFYLLAVLYPPSDIEIISESLRSESPRVRANATEALESLTTPQVARLIASLYERPPARLLELGQASWDMEYPDTARAIQQLVTTPDDPLLRAIATFALGQIGADLAREGRTAEVEAEAAPDLPFTRPEIEAMLTVALADPAHEVRLTAQAARQAMTGLGPSGAAQEEAALLSTIERIIFLKEVPFFQGMTIDQLNILANVCEEVLFAEDSRIFEQGDPGGALYVIVSGRVGIERKGQRKGSFVRLATIESCSYFGDMSLFDQGPRSAAAIAIQDTLMLRLRREPLLELVRCHPDLSLGLIDVLSQRLRTANDRIAQLTRARPRELQKLFDQFD